MTGGWRSGTDEPIGSSSSFFVCLVPKTAHPDGYGLVLVGLGPEPLVFTNVCSWDRLVRKFREIGSGAVVEEVLYWSEVPTQAPTPPPTRPGTIHHLWTIASWINALVMHMNSHSDRILWGTAAALALAALVSIFLVRGYVREWKWKRATRGS